MGNKLSIRSTFQTAFNILARNPTSDFVFEAWNILLLMLLIEEVRKNRMNHEYAVITSLWTLILLFVKFIPVIE
jgi:hypothetical protein